MTGSGSRPWTPGAGSVEREAEGLFARILQHEVDHLDGILYTHRLEDPRHLAFDGEVQALTAYLAEHDARSRKRQTSDD
jgi:hypothetical protein